MHAMAESAILDDRIVFPQEGATFFRMAAIAIVVNRELFQSSRAHSTMGVVAVTAHQFVFPNRVG